VSAGAGSLVEKCLANRIFVSQYIYLNESSLLPFNSVSRGTFLLSYCIAF
jgi:hypothetical protein